MSWPSTSPPRDGEPSSGGEPLKVRRALISVADKTGIFDFARGLQELGVEIVSTGGTAASLRESGLEVSSVESLTGAPEILGGRVKTLHPRLHAALLAKRDDPEHLATLAEQGIEAIDLVCVNLYPFEQTVTRRDVSDEVAVENIDIGGPTMIRAAAKNHLGVAVVVRPESYDAVLAELEMSEGTISFDTRHWLANEAFAMTAGYDAAISRWFGRRYEEFPQHWVVAYEKFDDLAYGENPHQRASLYTEVGARSHVLSKVAKKHGRALSFNNVLDLDSARSLLAEFSDPACVIVKHNNPCGTAVANSGLDAYEAALRCDPVSAFGAIIALNRRVDAALAERLQANFIEVLIAPGYDEDALEILRRKEALRILDDTEQRSYDASVDVKRVRGGMLVQDLDRSLDLRDQMTVVTASEPTEQQWEDLLFAWSVCRHVKSNAIVFASGCASIGIGAGQMSRVDSVRIAVEKATENPATSPLLASSVVASDAFFPFADGPGEAIRAGAKAIVQPGGSKRDEEVIAACDAAGVAMVLTGRRHFRH